MNNQTTTTSPKRKPQETAAEIPAIYEVICHSIEIDHLICYRTHRLRLTKAQAAAVNENQPDSLKFVGI